MSTWLRVNGIDTALVGEVLVAQGGALDHQDWQVVQHGQLQLAHEGVGLCQQNVHDLVLASAALSQSAYTTHCYFLQRLIFRLASEPQNMFFSSLSILNHAGAT